jgi:hypothetical protein
MIAMASLALIVPLTVPYGLGRPEGLRYVSEGRYEPLGVAAGHQTPTSSAPCEVTKPVQDRPPDDPHASSFQSPGGIWYANGDRTLWAWWWGRTSTGSYKVLWVRPVGSQLKVQGRRVDGPADPLTARIPDLYPWTYQASGLNFPAGGCWRVEATAGDASLTFVVRVP